MGLRRLVLSCVSVVESGQRLKGGRKGVEVVVKMKERIEKEEEMVGNEDEPNGKPASPGMEKLLSSARFIRT